MFSWLTDTGRFKDDEFQDDLDKLRDFFREHGYLDVEIPEEKIVFSYPKKDSLIITITVIEGRQYKIGDVTITGNKLHSTTLLKRVAALYAKTGAVFAPSKIDKATQRIEDYYGKDGYLDTRVHVIRRPNLRTNDIDLEFKVEESEKFNVESIQIEGNTKTKSVVIIRELILGPGDVFDTVRMKISKNRLENTRFFDDVDINPQDTNIPGRRDMRVTVKEGRTGTFTFGAGYSTLERATVFAQIQQTNFDLFNRRSFFQGDGEKFSIKVSIGELSNEAVISFEEPYLFEKVLAFGFSLFREHLLRGAHGGRQLRLPQAPVRAHRRHDHLSVRGGEHLQREPIGLPDHLRVRGPARHLVGLLRARQGHPRQDHQPDLRQPH
jgi:outer membrane protein insertion porin family